ncbi:MAG: hypothetical protein CM1200mP27_05490 [Chloroflexota bacterium]|nr:MAG: hypothetical protein CM1200mP27_05490 [Chloroflexota bacterium]
MDAALVGVISGLVSVPIVAVPTSTGYGASFEGLAPLLSMLNSCAPGVSIVNIDNGFGAGHRLPSSTTSERMVLTIHLKIKFPTTQTVPNLIWATEFRLLN